MSNQPPHQMNPQGQGMRPMQHMMNPGNQQAMMNQMQQGGYQQGGGQGMQMGGMQQQPQGHPQQQQMIPPNRTVPGMQHGQQQFMQQQRPHMPPTQQPPMQMRQPPGGQFAGNPQMMSAQQQQQRMFEARGMAPNQQRFPPRLGGPPTLQMPPGPNQQPSMGPRPTGPMHMQQQPPSHGPLSHGPPSHGPGSHGGPPSVHGPQSALNQPPSHGPGSNAPSVPPALQQSQHKPPTPQQLQQQPPPQTTLRHSPMPPHAVGNPASVGPRTVGGPPSVGPPIGSIPQPRSIQYANSPQIQQPASVQGNAAPVPTPGRAAATPAPPNPQPQIDKNDPEHKNLMAELLSFQPKTLVLLERVRADGRDQLERSLLGVLAIMKGERNADVKMLKKLIWNLKTSIGQLNPVRPLHQFASRISVVPTRFKNEPPVLPDKWDRLDLFKIRVPPRVAEHVHTEMQRIRQARKRKALEEGPDGEKAIKTESTVEIRCVSNKTKTVKLGKALADELTNFQFQIDPDFLPISEHVQSTQVLIEFKPKGIETLKYFVPPLRLTIPLDYPKAANPVQLCEQAPFRYDVTSPLQQRVLDALKKKLTEATMQSLTEVINTWRKVVIQQVVPASDQETRKKLLDAI